MNERDLMAALERQAEVVHPGAAPLAVMTGRAETVRRRRTIASVVAAAAAVAVVATTASVVGLGDDRASGPEVVSPGTVSGPLADALAIVPADSEVVYFNNRRQAYERLGLDGSSAEAMLQAQEDYIELGERRGDPGGLYGPMSMYLRTMVDLPFNDSDIVWSVQGGAGGMVGLDGYTVYQVTPETDLDAVADDLVAEGFEESDLMGRRHLVAENHADVTEPNGLIGGGYPGAGIFYDVTIDTEADLLITGAESADVLEVLDGDRSSLADTGTFDAVIGGATEVERVSLNSRTRCVVGDDTYGLEKPEQTAFIIFGADELSLTARLAFADGDSAARDAEARRDYLDSATFGTDDEPLADVGSADVSVDGTLETIELSDMGSEQARELTQVPGILDC